MPYLDPSRVVEAVDRLTRTVDPLFVDLLIVKLAGATAAAPIPMSTSSTAVECEVVMGVRRSDGTEAVPNRLYFNPFKHRDRWLKSGYPRSGVYSNLDGQTLARVVDFPRGPSPRRLTLKETYVGLVCEHMAVRGDSPVGIPMGEIAIWCARHESFPDGASLETIKDWFVGKFRITADERTRWFVEDAATTMPARLVAGEPAADELADLLVTRYPAAATTPVAPEVLPEPPPPVVAGSLYERLVEQMVIPEITVRQFVTLIRLGRNVILTGAPGTGKTTLAMNLAEEAASGNAGKQLPSCDGYLPTTATSDWTTFDTIGGYATDRDGRLVFREGLFLKAIRENKWLLIDELNRCDADKAFGQLFTVLSGQRVELPFEAEPSEKDGNTTKKEVMPNLSIRRDGHSTASRYDKAEHAYVIGADWRVIATMNTFDRSHLFQLSAAFVRRFAAVDVPVPTVRELDGWFDELDFPPWAKPRLKKLAKLLENERPVGPALLRDLVQYVTRRLDDDPTLSATVGAEQGAAKPTETTVDDEPESVESESDADTAEEASAVEAKDDPFLEAVIAYLLPQMDGLDRAAYSKLKRGLADFVRPGSRSALDRHFRQTLRV